MLNTLHSIDLPGKHISSGKVREIYEFDNNLILLITTDRLSAFDVILPDPIPYKGKVLNQMSLFWFKFFEDKVRNALVSKEIRDLSWNEPLADEVLSLLQGRSVLMKQVEVFPVECIVRGYLAGSGYKDYMRTGAICGHQLPEGLRKAEQLPKPIFTPSTKATEGHDENISVEEAGKIIGEDNAKKLEELSLMIYSEAAEYALQKGIIIADTKFEFGLLDGEIVLIDEVLTPDSSRFWPLDKVVPGEEPPSYDKQIVRNWLEDSGWGKTPPAPELPKDVLNKTAEAYREIFVKLTGKEVE
ncbi:MAG: phosphoribosylaminoimidazolesuccinocarboxamide synthase [Candidatus Electryonea clarkiae]|nr:phosphoribosylaminoimidazolesuccinocarboxamide synthase [Candidatus Electryonea clarkiae]MDP8288484.1 phosphoribosylaminoimidazolesuccinocarboxamide synthase [Candidatus Electryonea clarkiae]